MVVAALDRSAQQQDVGDGEFLRMREGQQRSGCTQGGKARSSTLMKTEVRGAPVPDNLDSLPEDPA